MNYAILSLDLEMAKGGCAVNVQKNRKEKYFHESVIAINVSNGREIFIARWYHRHRSPNYHCCVWVHFPTDNNGLHLAGGGVAQPGYGRNAKHVSLTRALEASGVKFTIPDNAFCDERINDFCRGIVDALNAHVKGMGFDPVDYVMAYAHA